MSNYETSHFLAPTGADMNFDLSSGTGWGPDYGDPATFLNTLAWEGDLFGNLGFDSKPEDRAIYNEVLGDYQALYEDAQENVSNVDVRYAKFAAAEAELLNSAVIMPNTTDGGGYAISRIIPRTNQRTFFGTDDSRFKYMVLTQDALTVDQRQEVLDDWDAKYAEYFGEEN
jgi:oligopeptide transport system substrate-binding protein